MSNPTPDQVAITQRGSFPRDDNSVPITQLGLATSESLAMGVTGNSPFTAPIFTITGTVLVNALYGVITTTVGNHTAAAWRLNDQTAQVYITAVGGTAITTKTAGSVLVKKGVAATALSLIDNATGVVSEPTTLETMYFSPFIATKKTDALTQIEYCYTTTDVTATGAITFYCSWIPISANGRVTPV